MAYEHGLHHSTITPFFGLDFHTALEIFNSNMPLAVESPFLSVTDSSSSGYLQDAIEEWVGNRCKRQRLLTTVHESADNNLVQDYWNWSFNGDPFANDGCWQFSGDPLCSSVTGTGNGATLSMETKSQEATATSSENERLSSSPSSYKDSLTNEPEGKEPSVSRDPLSSDRHCGKRKMKAGKRVAYPFTVVKPGGLEGDVTLDDINERILMRPTRPVRHPVGEFASYPCVSADGPGLSGKSVVALTRIHTQGRGTVTIIRTRG